VVLEGHERQRAIVPTAGKTVDQRIETVGVAGVESIQDAMVDERLARCLVALEFVAPLIGELDASVVLLVVLEADAVEHRRDTSRADASFERPDREAGSKIDTRSREPFPLEAVTVSVDQAGQTHCPSRIDERGGSVSVKSYVVIKDIDDATLIAHDRRVIEVPVSKHGSRVRHDDSAHVRTPWVR
jgi:hypothetical protein